MVPIIACPPFSGVFRRETALLLLVALAAGCGPVQGQRGGYMDFLRPDQRPPLVGTTVAADSLWGPPDQSERGDGIAESHRRGLEELVRRFAPTLVLPRADRATVNGRNYQLLPTDVRLVTDTVRLDLIRAAPYVLEDSVDIVVTAINADSMIALTSNALRYESDPQFLVAWYFDWPGAKPRQWWEAYGRFRTGADSLRWATPTVYAHPFLEAGRVVIQYWFFYPFNDFIANHEGDWEHINVALTPDRSAIEEVHYYFHARSVRLPQGRYEPEIVDGTHPVVHVGGRAYHILDFPIRLLAGDRNEGSHGNYPYPGEWEAAAGMGAPESVQKADRDSTRVIPYHRFRVVLTPEPGRIDYQRKPEVLKDWLAFLLPMRWGFPSAPSLGSVINTDVGNRAPFGPSYNPAWNRTAPGVYFTAYQVRKIPRARSLAEDLLQPWYYLYIFRTPRYVSDTRGGGDRRQLVRLGLAPRGGWAEKGLGSPLLGVHVGFPTDDFAAGFDRSTGISLWRNFWGKVRLGAFELIGGYQKFRRSGQTGGSLFVYPFTANVVARAPDGLFRPYVTGGTGVVGWESRVRISPEEQVVSSGWGLGWTAGLGIEYYLRTRVALDVAIRYYSSNGPGARAGLAGGNLNFFALWIGHYVRF
ncbi:MAG: hypothetical protein HY700_22115 [Gemmatimonadetes bacterium]|nr:hypothetical protein [Gemmatimonadota bacterium]